LFGGNIEAMQTHGESPLRDHVDASWHERILHAQLRIENAIIMGSDTPPDWSTKPQGIYVSVQIDDANKAENIFQQLASGGHIQMALEKTFWAERFGMVQDKFGTPWMISGATAICSPSSPPTFNR